MNRTLTYVLMPAALALPLTLLATPAQAQNRGIEACGDIDVSVDAECKIEVSGGCTAKCQPIAFSAACDAEIDVQCSGSAEASCTGSCEAEFEAKCEADPGISCEGECSGSCDANCEADCDAQASGGQASADCRAKCSASCQGSCKARCDVEPPSASCEARAKASCNAKCEARVNVQCRGEAYARCEAELTGGCQAQCQKPEGALYCNGQYVDAGGNLESCIDALNAWLTKNVDVSASGSASGECVNGECTGEAEGSVSAGCSVPAAQGRGGLAGMVTLAGALGLATVLRRRNDRH